MFCQGTGIVPLLPLLHDLLEEETETMVNFSTLSFFFTILQVSMVYSTASVAETLVLQDLHELCGFWNFQLEVLIEEIIESAKAEF